MLFICSSDVGFKIDFADSFVAQTVFLNDCSMTSLLAWEISVNFIEENLDVRISADDIFKCMKIFVENVVRDVADDELINYKNDSSNDIIAVWNS